METQIQGYIDAIQSEEVQNNFFYCQCTEVAVVLWAEHAIFAYPFTKMDSPESLKTLVSFLNSVKGEKIEDLHKSLGKLTYLSRALLISKEQILNRAPKTQQMAITISGNGIESLGDQRTMATLRDIKETSLYEGIQVNGVAVVLPEMGEFVRQKFLGNNLPRITEQQTTSIDIVQFYQDKIVNEIGHLTVAPSNEEFAKAIKESTLRDTCRVTM